MAQCLQNEDASVTIMLRDTIQQAESRVEVLLSGAAVEKHVQVIDVLLNVSPSSHCSVDVYAIRACKQAPRRKIMILYRELAGSDGSHGLYTYLFTAQSQRELLEEQLLVKCFSDKFNTEPSNDCSIY